MSGKHNLGAVIIGVGLLLSVVAAAQVTRTYNYDELGRLTTVSPSNGSSTSYSYDLADNRTCVSTGSTSGCSSSSSAAPPTCSSSTITANGLPVNATATYTVTSSAILALCTDSAGYTLTITSPTSLPKTMTLAVGSSSVSTAFTVSDGHGNTASGSITEKRP